MKRILMIAFHYPPFQGSSGVLRTWSFSRFLPEFDCAPIVLTATKGAYGDIDESAPGTLQVPGHVDLWRAWSLDTARHLTIAGRYPRWLALPDRWVSWYAPAVATALRIVRRHRPDVLWSTYPIATAHMVAATVKRLTGLPWVADFRDSMTEDDYPRDPRTRRSFLAIERRTVQRADAIVFTADGARRMYAERYPDPQLQAKYRVISNGYDEESFARAEALAKPAPADRPLTLLHSGVLYPSERDPLPFFRALAELQSRGVVNADSLRIVLRASGHDAVIAPLIEQCGIGGMVKLAGSMPYEAALTEMLEADGLLLFQAANCNHQIPAKLYEYLRSGRPIFALTDMRGDTAQTLLSGGVNTIADLADTADIVAKLPTFLHAVRSGTAPVVDRENAQRFSRRSRAGELAGLLQRLAGAS